MGKAERRLSEGPAVGGAPALAGDGGSPTGTASEVRSIGLYLARQRELRGISLEELSALTRIPRRSLERLEGGAFDADPDGFARGFVRTVARALGLPADETVARMLPEADASRRSRQARALAGVRWLAWLAAIGLAAALAAVAWERLPSGAGRPAASDDLVWRRDAVRELAAEVSRAPGEARRAPRGPAGADGGPGPAGAGSGAPEPPPPHDAPR